MTYWDRKLIREQLDGKLNSLKGLASQAPERGWIRVIREALGISSQQLAKRIGFNQSRISRLEKAEPKGDLKLSSLKKIADALDMNLVYGFVPKESLESLVQKQARKVALKRMRKLNHTMRLEKQELSDEEKEKALENMIQKILIEEPKDLWDS
jgi:predicted DNA-binding mobile mystery protein A